jgi:hypothetical protein
MNDGKVWRGARGIPEKNDFAAGMNPLEHGLLLFLLESGSAEAAKLT